MEATAAQRPLRRDLPGIFKDGDWPGRPWLGN